ncbi:hypothetical protein D9M70_332150 [compost metagenome]
MLAPRGDVVAGREFLDHLDVRRQPRAREHALEQIVAEHRVLGNAPGERGLEGIDVVDALAGVGAFAEQVLVDVGHRGRVGVHAAGAGRQALVERAFAAQRQRRRHARLQDGVAAHHALFGIAPAHAVQGVGHLADQAQRRVARQPGVGIQRDDVAHAGQDVGLPRFVGSTAIQRHEAGVGGAAQQPVEFVEFATLALPAHPAVLAGVEPAPAVQQVEALAARGRAVPLVQCGDGLLRDADQVGVAVEHFRIRIEAIRQQGKGQVATCAGQMVDFEALDVAAQFRFAGQQRGHDDQCAQVGGNPVDEGQGREAYGARARGDCSLDQGRGHLGGGQECGQRECRQQPGGSCRRGARGKDGPERQAQQHRCQREDGGYVAAKPEADVEAVDAHGQRWPESDGLLQFAAPFSDQVMAGICHAGVLNAKLGRLLRSRQRQRPLSDR